MIFPGDSLIVGVLVAVVVVLAIIAGIVILAGIKEAKPNEAIIVSRRALITPSATGVAMLEELLTISFSKETKRKKQHRSARASS